MVGLLLCVYPCRLTNVGQSSDERQTVTILLPIIMDSQYSTHRRPIGGEYFFGVKVNGFGALYPALTFFIA